MTHTTNDAPVTVEQCDRDLYALIAPDMCALILDGELDQHRELQAIARHRLAALASTPAGVNITVRQKDPVVADYGDNFLVAHVSADGKTVGIDHPCDAVWSDVDRAQTALRDYINERIAAQDKCPFKPRGNTASAPAGDGVEDARAIILQHSEKWVAEYVEREGELPDTMVFRFPFVEKLLAAALARPRAAVGEREA